ncbi:MAG: hypothetical protein J7M34_11150 [Anaerolineae bacterium]|nr:hypothetical protein [Anaerolineae bacterium]
MDATTRQPLVGAWVHVDDRLVRTDAQGWFAVETQHAAANILVRAVGHVRGRWVVGPSTLVSKPAWDAIHPLSREMKGAQMHVTQCGAPPCVEIQLAPFPVYALYIPMTFLKYPDRVQQLLDLAARSLVLNAVVIDAKGDKGELAWNSSDPTARAIGAYRGGKAQLTLVDFLKMCRERDLYVIARMVVFKDARLAEGRPELAIWRADGSLWTDQAGSPWLNPFLSEVWEYHVALAREIASLSVDEIQLDYIRFPSDGNLQEVQYGRENTLDARTMAIRQFVERLAEEVHPLGTFVAADVFGLTVWVAPESDMRIGQRVMDIAPIVDYLSPMVYPSTFITGNLGLASPVDHPYEVVQRSVAQARKRVPAHTCVRPWLQAYGYSLADMQIQRYAAREGTASGWMFWNASGKYPAALFGVLPPLDELKRVSAASEK